MEPRPSTPPPEGLPPFFQYLRPAQESTEKEGVSQGNGTGSTLPIPGAHRAINDSTNTATSSDLSGRKIIDVESIQPSPATKSTEQSNTIESIDTTPVAKLARFAQFESLSDAEVDAYVNLIKENKQNPEFVALSERIFLNNLNPAIKEALEIHSEFRHLFPNERLATMNAKTGAVLCTIEQFKTALAIAHSKFPNLLSLPSSEEQNVLAARLIQTILCGEEALKANLPRTAIAFHFKELHGQSLGPIPANIPEGQTYAFNNLNLQTLPTKSDLESMKIKIRAAVLSFVLDNFERVGNTFQTEIKGQVFANGAGAKPGEQNVLEAALNLFVGTLRNQPSYTKSFLAASRESPFYKLVSELFDEEPSPDKTTIKQILTDQFIQLLKKNQNRPDVCKNIEYFMKLFDIPQNVLEEIAGKAQCTPKECETLILMKILELATVLQQGSLQERSLHLTNFMMGYQGPGTLASKGNGGMRCCFMTPNCDSLHLLNKFNINSTSDPVDVGERFLKDYEFNLATIDTIEIVPSMSSLKDHNVSIFPVANPRFNWKVPLEFIDFMAQNIPLAKPLAVSKFDKVTLQKQLLASQKVLEDIAKLTSGQVLKSDGKGSIYAAPIGASEAKGLFWIFQKDTKPLSEMESLNDLMVFVKELHSQLAAYKLASIHSANPSESSQFLDVFKDKVLNASFALGELWMYYMHNNQNAEKDKLQEIMSVLTSDVAALLPSPKSKSVNEVNIETVTELLPPAPPMTAAHLPKEKTSTQSSYIFDTASWIYGAVTPLFTPKTLTSIEKLSRFKGMRVSSPEAVAIVKDYLKTTPKPENIKSLPLGEGRTIALPNQFYYDLLRLSKLKINGKIVVNLKNYSLDSEEGRAAHLKDLGQQCIQIQTELGISERVLKHISRFAHQQIIHGMVGRLMSNFTEVNFAGGLDSIDFRLVEDKGLKKIKISLESILEPWTVGEEGKKDHGFIGARLDILIPALEMLANPDTTNVENLLPHAEVFEIFTRICKTREEAVNRLG